VEASHNSRKLSELAVTDDHRRLQVLTGGSQEVPQDGRHHALLASNSPI
jgi:hypothetical protein